MTSAKPLTAALLKRGGRKATLQDQPPRKTYRKVGVRLDLDRYAAFKAFCARAGITGEQVLERALDQLLSTGNGQQ